MTGDTARDRWQRGDCPCCGASLDWWPADPQPVGEGVILCGRCIENQHHAGDLLPQLLEAIVTGRDPVTGKTGLTMPWRNSPADRARTQRIYGSREYQAARAQVMRAAAGRCASCGRTARLQCDHILPVSQGGTHHVSNLQALCRHCHGKKTGEQHGWNAPRQQVPPDPQPEPRTRW